MYELKEEQVAKINAILENLKDEDKQLFSEKVESLRDYNNAEERINKLIDKDIAEIKKVLSVLKSRKKKENELKEILSFNLKNILSEVVQCSLKEIIILREKLDEIIPKKKEEEIANKKKTIAELQAEIKELEENY